MKAKINKTATIAVTKIIMPFSSRKIGVSKETGERVKEYLKRPTYKAVITVDDSEGEVGVLSVIKKDVLTLENEKDVISIEY